MVYPFSEEEHRIVVAVLKTTKPLEKKMFGGANNDIGPKARVAAGNAHKCFMGNKIPTILKQAQILPYGSLVKPAIPKSYQPYPRVSDVQRMILNRMAPTIERHIIKEQAGFRPGKPFTSQLQNIIQHIQDGYQKNMMAETGYVDLSAAKIHCKPETLNHVN